MRPTLWWFAAGALLGWTVTLNSARSFPSQSAAQVQRSQVVVELFTSEGCSSCPTADELLGKLEAAQPIAGVEIIGLEEHVDYWNHDGWTDPYSSGEWTTRQQEYVARLKLNTPYTPQMIVDGQAEFGGNDVPKVQGTIQQAAKLEKWSISIAAGVPGKSNVLNPKVEVSTIRGASEGEKADLWLAITEAGLRTSVSAGENKGHTWEHASIVRSLQKIGSISPGHSAPFLAQPQVKLQHSWKTENLRVVVFVQERKSGKIVGAVSAKAASL